MRRSLRFLLSNSAASSHLRLRNLRHRMVDPLAMQSVALMPHHVVAEWSKGSRSISDRQVSLPVRVRSGTLISWMGLRYHRRVCRPGRLAIDIPVHHQSVYRSLFGKAHPCHHRSVQLLGRQTPIIITLMAPTVSLPRPHTSSTNKLMPVLLLHRVCRTVHPTLMAIRMVVCLHRSLLRLISARSLSMAC